MRPLLLLLILLIPLSLTRPAAAADLFGHDDGPAPAAAAHPIEETALPAPLAALLGHSVAIQKDMNERLRAALRQARDGDSWAPGLTIIAVSFLYGVFHAAGPGHGKMVVGSYFLTRRARLLHGLAMSGSAAFVQALSAVVLVGLLAMILGMGSRQILDHAAVLEMVSYGSIVGLGLWMAVGIIRGDSCCDDHGEEAHGHHHDHGHDACGCGHDHDHHPVPAPKAAPRSELWRVLSTGAAVGLRPCSGAILVLLFTLANGIFPIGVLSTFAMGLGVMITVSLVSLGALGLHRGLGGLAARHDRLARLTHRGLGLGGALLIAALGGVQLYGLWAGIIPSLAG
jgi:ABC-type nickel/cobalt efflux system permease component RcnA